MSSKPFPYGKEPIDQNVERGLTGANDSLAYKKEKKTVVIGPGSTMMNDVQEEVEERPEALSPEEHNEKYKKTDWKKRYDELKRHHDRKVNGFKEEIESYKQARPKFTPPKTPEDLATFRAENPDIYDVVETVAHMRASDEMEQLKSTVAKLEAELKQQEQAKAMAELKMMVPDYEQIANSDDFRDWAEQQPREIQKWIFENATNALLAAKAINLYKADRGVQNVRKPSQVQSAADAVTTGRATSEPTRDRGGRVFTTSELARMNWREYDKLKDEIDQAHREGRVVRG